MKKTLLLFAVVLLSTSQSVAKQVMCLKTNGGQYIELARVSMMVVPDGGSTFEIVVKDGEGATGVENISFEKHDSDIDLSKYGGSSSGSESIDMTKPVFLLTNTGKYFYMKDLPVMTAQDGSSAFEVKVGSTVESSVSKVFFYRGPAEGVEEYMTAGISAPKSQPAEEKLELLTPIGSQMTISGCGAATEAVLYAADGRQMGVAPVNNGVTTVQVGHLDRGVYFVKVGRTSLKFMKR